MGRLIFVFGAYFAASLAANVLRNTKVKVRYRKRWN